MKAAVVYWSGTGNNAPEGEEADACKALGAALV